MLDTGCMMLDAVGWLLEWVDRSIGLVVF